MAIAVSSVLKNFVRYMEVSAVKNIRYREVPLQHKNKMFIYTLF